MIRRAWLAVFSVYWFHVAGPAGAIRVLGVFAGYSGGTGGAGCWNAEAPPPTVGGRVKPGVGAGADVVRRSRLARWRPRC